MLRLVWDVKYQRILESTKTKTLSGKSETGVVQIAAIPERFAGFTAFSCQDVTRKSIRDKSVDLGAAQRLR